MSRFTARNAKELAVFGVFIGAIHYAYYKIQNNPNLVPPRERTELFYVRWLKENVPGLSGIGLKDPETPRPEH
ncbi:hypothetical protein FO519_008962 [Halicephalobus sp. NKZ332]|nr:hypothetical protein FO519_008962 [Halicephalobus sp. NKZ332]